MPPGRTEFSIDQCPLTASRSWSAVGPRGDVVPGERRDLAVPHERTVDGGDRLEPGPGRLAAETGWRHRAAAVLLTPVRGFHTLAALHRVRRGLRQSRLDPGQQLGLVGFDGQQVVSL